MRITREEAASCQKLLEFNTEAEVREADHSPHMKAWAKIGWCNSKFTGDTNPYFDLFLDEGTSQMLTACAFCISLYEDNAEF